MLTRNGRKILDQNLTCLIQMDGNYPTVLEELVLDIHEYPDLVTAQIINHRLFHDCVIGLFRLMDIHIGRQNPAMYNPRLSGNAAYVLGALVDSDDGRDKILENILKGPKYQDEVANCLPNLAELIEINDLESKTNASGTASLLVQNEEYREWALEQHGIDFLIDVLTAHLHQHEDMWVASNCALTLARICMEPAGRLRITSHGQGESYIIMHLIHSLGCDQEGKGMNAAFALAYIMEDESGIRTIAYLRDVLDMILNLINMLKSVNDDIRKNAVFCLKKMSQWPEGQDRLNDDPDIDHLLRLLCNLMTSGVEDLGKMAAVTLKNMADRREGYMLQKDHSEVKTVCRTVLSQMEISEAYRHDAFETLKAVLIPKPDPPEVEVMDAFTVEATWQPVVAKSGAHVWYELYNGDSVVYTGALLAFVETGLKERTDYSYSVRALTDDNEESFASEVTVVCTHKAVSSPPINLRATQVTAKKVKIEWEIPEKLMGTFKGYYVQEMGSSIHYEPVYPYHIASNLNADSEYSFQVCVVTNKGRGRMAKLTVKTLRQDYNAPSRPRLIAVAAGEWVVTWDQPERPSGRINGYEVTCNGKSIFFGPKTRCIASNLAPSTKYKFVVKAHTTDGYAESEPAVRKTGTESQRARKFKDAPKFKNKEDLFRWLDSQEIAELEEAAQELGITHSDEDEDEPQSPRKVPKAKSPRAPIAPPPRVREPQFNQAARGPGPARGGPPQGGPSSRGPSKREEEQLRGGPPGRGPPARGPPARPAPPKAESGSPKPKPPTTRRPPPKKQSQESQPDPKDDIAKKRAERREAEKRAAEKRREKLASKQKKAAERDQEKAEEEASEEAEQSQGQDETEPADDSLEREDTTASQE